MSVVPPSHRRPRRRPRRFTRLQKVSAATGVAAVGAAALAVGLGTGGDQGTVRVADPEAQPKPLAWQTAAHSAEAQRAGIDRQSANAADRAGAEARRKAAAEEQTAARKAATEKARAAKRAEAARHAEADRKKRKAEAAEREREAAARAEHTRQGAADRSAQRSTSAGSESSAGSTSAPSTPSGSPQQIARQLLGDDAQFQCFSNIVERESGWNVTAENPSSGAYGLVQALPGSKMASAGADWRTNPATQIRWGIGYMKSTYGSPCGAWSFWQSHNWY